MSRYRQTLLKQVRQFKNINEQDEQDHEISMARGELEAIADKATQLASALQGKSDDGNPLEAWVQSKITKAKDYINSVSDYMMYKPEEVKEATYGWTLVSKAKDIAKKFANNLTKAVAEIEKLEKGLSKNSTVAAELRKYNESLEEKFTVQITKKDGTTMELGRYNTAAEAQRYVDMYGKGAKVKKEESDLEEASLKDIFTANQEGKKADEIAKKLGMSVSDVKKILGEEIGEISEENLDEFTSDMIKRLKKSYSTMPQRLSTDQANALSRHLDRLDLVSLKQLAKEKIPFITTLARNKIYKKTGKFEDVNEQDGKIGPAGKIALAKEKDTDNLEKQLKAAQGQINVLKQKLENEKNKAIKPMPNPETGEVPLTIGIANKLLKDKEEKEAKEKKQKENSQKISQLSKETKLEEFTRKFLSHLTESDASDKAKAMGLDYMKFGRYGKDGKVTHKSVGGNLQALGKKDQEKEKDVTKTPKAEPKKPKTKSDDEVDTKIKSRNFLKDLDKGNLEDEDGEPIEIIFDDGDPSGAEAAIKAAEKMGLEDLANDLDDVAYHISEYESDVAQAKFQDIMSKYSGKPVKAVEFAKKAEKSIELMADQAYAYDPTPFASDLMSTMSIVKKMVDSDETEGNVGSGMSNSSKGFRPEVIDTLQQLDMISDHAAQLEDEYDGNDEKVRDILADLQGEINFITDESADHDNYTKPHKVNSSVDTIIDLTKELQKRLKNEKVKTPSKAKVPNAKEMKKDLEAVLSDGVAEIEFNGSEIDMAKEYEASQDYDAEKDAEAIRKYFKKKGVSLKKDDIEIEKFDDYISLTLNKNINETFVQTKKIFNEERRLYVESIAAVKKKAEKTGMPYSILKQVYDRGMAAWKGGQ